jgi:hypothetical protein
MDKILDILIEIAVTDWKIGDFNKLRGFSLQVNYTNQASAAYRRS